MSSIICFNLDKSKILSSGNGLNTEAAKLHEEFPTNILYTDRHMNGLTVQDDSSIAQKTLILFCKGIINQVTGIPDTNQTQASIAYRTLEENAGKQHLILFLQ